MANTVRNDANKKVQHPVTDSFNSFGFIQSPLQTINAFQSATSAMPRSEQPYYPPQQQPVQDQWNNQYQPQQYQLNNQNQAIPQYHANSQQQPQYPYQQQQPYQVQQQQPFIQEPPFPQFPQYPQLAQPSSQTLQYQQYPQQNTGFPEHKSTHQQYPINQAPPFNKPASQVRDPQLEKQTSFGYSPQHPNQQVRPNPNQNYNNNQQNKIVNPQTNNFVNNFEQIQPTYNTSANQPYQQLKQSPQVSERPSNQPYNGQAQLQQNKYISNNEQKQHADVVQALVNPQLVKQNSQAPTSTNNFINNLQQKQTTLNTNNNNHPQQKQPPQIPELNSNQPYSQQLNNQPQLYLNKQMSKNQNQGQSDIVQALVGPQLSRQQSIAVPAQPNLGRQGSSTQYGYQGSRQEIFLTLYEVDKHIFDIYISMLIIKVKQIQLVCTQYLVCQRNTTRD